MKVFRPISWYSVSELNAPGKFVAHVLTELGRLGLEIHDIERDDRPPNSERILSDLLDSLGGRLGEGLARLIDWQTLDLKQMHLRLEQNASAKPRIEISAHITQMNNLSVRWHPGGWRNSDLDWNRARESHADLISQRKWRQPADFHWFVGDEEPLFDRRPSNELIYIRGVGNLKPEPRESYGAFATYNHDVVHAILICAVRSTYEALIAQLRLNFEVDVLDAFDFVTRDEIDPTATFAHPHSIRRVIKWTLEDAADIRRRHEAQAAAAVVEGARAELSKLSDTYGFTLEACVEALVTACPPLSPSPTIPAAERVEREAAKALRAAGYKASAGQVRSIRQLIELCMPEVLPETLRPATKSAPNNIVPFPRNKD